MRVVAVSGFQVRKQVQNTNVYTPHIGPLRVHGSWDQPRQYRDVLFRELNIASSEPIYQRWFLPTTNGVQSDRFTCVTAGSPV